MRPWLLLAYLCAQRCRSSFVLATKSGTKWNPSDGHPCTIKTITEAEFSFQFGPRGLPPLYSQPLVILANNNNATNHSNHRFRQFSQQGSILDQFPPQFHVTLSSSNSFSEHRRDIPFHQYLEESVTGETLPEHLANETWYLFGETFTDHWNAFLADYELPKCEACVSNLVALSFGIGGKGSGVSWHVHGPGFSETLHGRKHWLMAKEKPSFHPNQTSRNWMEYNYYFESNQDVLECTLDPGDVLYFPDMWWHATVNLDSYTAFVSTFTQEHLFRKAGEL